MQTIRDCLDHFIGRTVVDISSHDPGVDDPDSAHITFLFDDGSHVRFPLGDDGCAWGTINNCLEHIGCIAGESSPPDPARLIATDPRLTRGGPMST
jgi:hypothetical protein